MTKFVFATNFHQFVFIFHSFFSFHCLIAGYCQNIDESIPTSHHDSPPVVPKFLSRGHLYKAIVGDTIELPCKVQNLGKTFKHLGFALNKASTKRNKTKKKNRRK